MMYTLLGFLFISFFAVSFQDEGKSRTVKTTTCCYTERKLIIIISILNSVSKYILKSNINTKVSVANQTDLELEWGDTDLSGFRQFIVFSLPQFHCYCYSFFFWFCFSCFVFVFLLQGDMQFNLVRRSCPVTTRLTRRVGNSNVIGAERWQTQCLPIESPNHRKQEWDKNVTRYSILFSR